MKIATSCPHCGTALELDASYVGTRRVCPSCEERFLFEVDEATLATRHAEERAAARLPTAPRLEHLGCAACRVSYNRRLKGNETEVRCAVCGQPAPLAQAIADGRRFDEVERTMWDLVQRGEAGAAIDLLARQGLPLDKARQRVDNAAMMLPFVRSEWRFSAPVAHPEPCSPPWCEACERSIDPLHAARVMWRRDHNVASMTATVGPALVGGLLGTAGADLGSVTSGFLRGNDTEQRGAEGADHMEGLYYLCGPCLRAGPRAFRSHRRFPAGQGLSVTEVSALAP